MDRITELTQRAETMPALIMASTPAAEAERIEREHAAILDEVNHLRQVQQIATRAGLDWTAFQNMPIDQARAAVLEAMRVEGERFPMFTHVAIGSEGPNRAAEDYIFARMRTVRLNRTTYCHKKTYV